jgi:hypothetical protein
MGTACMPSTDLHFLLPEPDAVLAQIPTSAAEFWDWQSTAADLTPYWGRYHWIIQTFLYLREAGLPVVLTNQIPDKGILLTHADCIDYGFRPTYEQYLVVMLVDREVPHPRAQVHVLHNPTQRLHLAQRHHYMPPWPQVGLIGRDATRGDRFETLGYFGYPVNLDPEIKKPEFVKRIHDLGLRFVIPTPANWHDFHQIDCLLAIRNFGRNEEHRNKPSLKLFNAWLAGVPAVLGHESAYRHEGSPGLGYLEATSTDEILVALQCLRDQTDLRRKISQHGREAVRAYCPERTVIRWQQFIQNWVWPDYHLRLRTRTGAVRDAILGTVRERVNWRRPGWF